MIEIHVEHPVMLSTPPCEVCGRPTRIYGIEPHPRLPHTDINTYICDVCDRSQVLVAPVLMRAG
jgi:hypothetical protein